MTRRQFMATTGGAMLWGTRRAWAAANDRVRVAVVGGLLSQRIQREAIQREEQQAQRSMRQRHPYPFHS